VTGEGLNIQKVRKFKYLWVLLIWMIEVKTKN